MEKLKNPINKHTYVQIESFYFANQSAIKKPKHSDNLDTFIQNNPLFLPMVEDLTDGYEQLAWRHLRRLALSDGQSTRAALDKSLGLEEDQPTVFDMVIGCCKLAMVCIALVMLCLALIWYVSKVGFIGLLITLVILFVLSHISGRSILVFLVTLKLLS